MIYIILFLISFLFFLIIDLAWLGIFAKKTYQKYIGDNLSKKPKWIVAFIFYVIYNIFLVVFVIEPAIYNSNIYDAITYGASFGFITYATYDLTNYATLKSWSLNIVFIDIIWGSFLVSLVSLMTFITYGWLF